MSDIRLSNICNQCINTALSIFKDEVKRGIHDSMKEKLLHKCVCHTEFIGPKGGHTDSSSMNDADFDICNLTPSIPSILFGLPHLSELLMLA